MSDLTALYVFVSAGCSDAEILAYLAPCSYTGRRVVREALAGIRDESRYLDNNQQGEVK